MQNEPKTSREDRVEIGHLIITIGAALHRCGAAAHHIEGALSSLAKSLLAGGQFFVTPTAIVADLEYPDGERLVRLIRVQPQGIELNRLSFIDEIGDRLIRREINCRQALEALHELEQRPETPNYLILETFGFAVATATFCGFLGGNTIETGLSAVLGLLLWAWLRLTSQKERWFGVAEAFGAFVLAIIGQGLSFVLPMKAELVILSGLIVLIPGLSITIALSELSTKNWMAGTARLTGALTELLKLSFAVVLGTRLITAAKQPFYEIKIWDQQPVLELIPSPFWVILAGLSFAVLFRVRNRDIVWVVTGAAIAYYSTTWGGQLLGAGLGVFIGGVALKSYSNGYARFLHRPALTVLLPSLIILVPGSIGFRSFNLMFAKDVIQSLNQAAELMIVAVALVAGLNLGHLLIHPRRNV